MADKYKALLDKIDEDAGLASKRKILTIVSLIMLAIQFSGAKVVEANTFILKLSFSHQNGLGLLLAIAIAFLIIRYYNYARSYHQELFDLWSTRMLNDSFFFLYCHDSNTLSGLIVDLANEQLNMDLNSGKYQHEYPVTWTYKYNFPFSRSIIYAISGEYETEEKDVVLRQVGLKTLLKVLNYETKYRLSSIFTHRENLDIYAPYLLGTTAIFSYFFSAELQSLISQLSVISN